MKTSVRIAILMPVYALFAFGFFIAKAFFIKNVSFLFPEDVFYWRFITGLYEFLYWLPAILASVGCIGFSWSFGKDTGKNLERFSPVQLKNFRAVLVAAGVSVVLCFAAVEILIPLISASKKRLENRVQDYTWYIGHAQSAYAEGNASAAVFYAENALALQPANAEAKRLRDAAQRLSASGGYIPAETVSAVPSDLLKADNTPYSALILLKKAQAAFDSKDYFNAHYYAWWAYKLAGDNDANSAEMQRLATDSWNTIARNSGFETDENAQIFRKKREGYSALMEGDVLHAYYIFLDLYEISDFDPDIVRFYRLSTEALLQQYFFIDEVQNLAFFEKFKNISFKIKRPDGGFDAVRIGGVTTIAHTDSLVKYLRNYSSVSYDASGTLIGAMSVPYVKLIAQKAGSFGSDFGSLTGIKDAETFIPRLLCTSVDRKTRGIVISPVYSEAHEEHTIRDSVRVLPMSLKDFDLVCSASSEGPLYMNLASLFRFVPLADDYGFPVRIYQAFLLQRFARPFLLFALFILLALIAWDLKLESSQVFRFVWIFSFPVFTAVVMFCIEFLRYLIILLSYGLASFSLYAELLTALILLFAAIVILSLRFLSLYEKKYQ
ncbi:hypothetical protein V1L52_03540 [Treponema sp. HNW]|uniref:tetratricopeptide repeat protein n=1 Tax=Treponema sp. HNW TaxID=3116654 RepID=UPI003D0C6BBE